MDTAIGLAPHYQGYVDERSTHHVKGWLRNLNNAAQRLDYEVVLPKWGGERILARGTAEKFSDMLRQVGVGDGCYAFSVRFDHPLSAAERDRVFVRPAGSKHKLKLAPALVTTPPGNGPYQGFLDERSTRHVAGWLRDLSELERRVELEIIITRGDGSQEVLESCTADALVEDTLAALRDPLANYGFYRVFARELSVAERDSLFVRVAGGTHIIEQAPALRTAYEPIHHIAMDIVNNCNLRCPFCVYDYEGVNKTEFMTDETFDAFAKLIPYVRDGNFWLSCLHEATMHPKLLDFIGRVPPQYRRKIFFTTNLAKRMPEEYFAFLASSGLSHVNISIESMEPKLYERMRKGARHPIFLENWEKLLRHFRAAENPPKLRYNIMAYRSNLEEIPSLIRLLRAEKQAWQIEVRHTFSQSHIPIDFQRGEFLTSTEWKLLEEGLKEFPPTEVLQLWPPDGSGYEVIKEKPAEGEVEKTDIEKISIEELRRIGIPRPFNLQASWDGSIKAYTEALLITYFNGNINEMVDPLAELFAL
jgi:pyruvate-formate lyase-activating enzyme